MKIFRLYHASLLLVLAAAVGCGGATTTGSVAGKVTYQGKPLNAGTITFQGDNNRVATATIDPEGNYHVPGAPVGDVKVGVVVPPPASAPPPGAPPTDAAVRNAVQIPRTYADATKSGITLTVKRGSQTHDVVLK